LLLLGLVAVVGVAVPYSLCSSAGAHLKIVNVTSTEWPPKKGDTMTVTFDGIIDETVTAGTWAASGKWDGFPLPSSNGNIDTFYPLPWPKGPLTFSFPEPIPSESPSGSYTIKLSAVDQDKQQLFCVDLAFKLNTDINKTDLMNRMRGKSHQRPIRNNNNN